ncbi:ABC transporter permease [Actinoplanes sp. CA-142083]|uniref:ABC transporter permease n=1 Tax=Actinoplanes sp. CA-142083 TaxID=3239903 RepID=UPI003D89F6A9
MTSSYVLADSGTMIRRDMRRMVRFPIMTISGISFPLLMMLLFVYVFGTAISGGAGRGTYVNYVAPAILIMTIGGGGSATAININTDMSEGVIARLRTMAISRFAVLSGQVGGSIIRTAISLILVVGVAYLIGFRPEASGLDWLAVAGLLALVTFAVSWMTAAFGMVAKTQAGANSLSLLFTFGPFVSSAFVPTDTMPAGVRWFAENQPFTPIIDTLRHLLDGTPVGNTWILAVAWTLLLSTVGILWSRSAFMRLPTR